jgi:hypothetical protein
MDDNAALIQKVIHSLVGKDFHHIALPPAGLNFATSSSVLLLLGRCPDSAQPCLILNKRSARVRQPGDLCCPGGGILPRPDRLLSTLLKLPFTPLTRWPYWKQWHRRDPHTARACAILFATGLRECFEEMRLNPLGVKFLGLLPPQSLVMFDRVIYPLVAWVNRQHRFYPNWEVEKIVYIPLHELLKSENYARYRLYTDSATNPKQALYTNDFPCYHHTTNAETEILWGATYQITSAFLMSIFDFCAPDWTSLPVIEGTLDDNYLTGQR